MLTSCSGPDPVEVQKAKELCEDLLKNVREQYEEFKARPPQRGGNFGNTGYGGERGYGDRPERSNSYGGDRNGGGGGGGYGGGGYSNSPAPNSAAMSPTTPAAPGAGSPTAAADYSAQYAQYYGGADPYAAYGGYAAYCQYYQQYMAAAAAAAQQTAPGAPPGSSAPPPPPNEVSKLETPTPSRGPTLKFLLTYDRLLPHLLLDLLPVVTTL